MRPSPPDPRPTPARKGLPRWVWAVIVLGLVLGGLGLLCAVLPLAFLFWAMGSGHQFDTRPLVSPDSAAALWVEVDPDDPGVRDFMAHAIEAYPEMVVRVRQAQGYPTLLAEMEALRDRRNLSRGLPSLVPAQMTLTLEQDPVGAPADLMLAVNLPRWGRAIRLGMHFVARMQEWAAESDPAIRPAQRLEVGEHPLWVTPSRDGELFWGAMGGTVLFGGGAHDRMVSAMGRIDREEHGELHADLQAAVTALGPQGFELWGALRYVTPVVDKVWPEPATLEGLSDSELEELQAVIEEGAGAVAGMESAVAEQLEAAAQPRERNCLAELEPSVHRSMAFGIDIVSADEIVGRSAVLLRDDSQVELLERCLMEGCESYRDEFSEDGLELSCELERVDGAVLGTARLTGIVAAMEHWMRELEAEMQAQQSTLEATSTVEQLPPELMDLPELEGLEY